MVPTRAVWADILRILAMFFVVFIHVSPLPQTITLQNSIYFVNFAIVKTCIALFFMLSGAFLLSKEEAYRPFFQKRVLKVVFPWLVWTIIYMLVQIFLQCKSVQSLSELKYFFEITFLTKFWILPVLVGLYLLTPIFRILIKHAKTRDLYYLLSLWVIVISVFPFFHNGPTFPIYFPPGLFSQVLMCSGFFIGGYVLLHLPKKYSTSLISLGIITIGIIITILSAFFKSGEKMTDIEGFAYSIFAPGMVLVTAGIFLLFYSLEATFEKWPKRTKYILSVMSIASFGVYLTHELLHDLFRMILIKYNTTYLLRTDLATDYIRTIIIFMLATILVIVIQKTPYIKRILP